MHYNYLFYLLKMFLLCELWFSFYSIYKCIPLGSDHTHTNGNWYREGEVGLNWVELIVYSQIDLDF